MSASSNPLCVLQAPLIGSQEALVAQIAPCTVEIRTLELMLKRAEEFDTAVSELAVSRTD